MLRSWALFISRLNESYGPRLQALPENPTPNQLESEARWLAEMFSTYNEILQALSEARIVEACESAMNAVEAGESIPDEVRLLATDFQDAYSSMLKLGRTAAIWFASHRQAIPSESDIDRIVREWSEQERVAVGVTR